jgi:hypothetical protein
MSRGRIRPSRPKSRATSEDKKRGKYENFPVESKLSRPRSKQKYAFLPSHIELQQPFVPTLFAEEESVAQTEKSDSGTTTLSKKIEINYIREIERFAAIRIQSWWKGILARKDFHSRKIEFQVKKAEAKARKAVEEYERLRNFAEKLRPKSYHKK